MVTLQIELTLENFRTIKLWHRLLFKDREQTQNDIEVFTKISALMTSEIDRDLQLKKWFRKYGRVL